MTGVQRCALRSEEHTSELQSHDNLVCRLLLEKKKSIMDTAPPTRLPERVHPGHTPPPAAPPTPQTPRTPAAASALAPRPIRPFCFFLKDPAPPEISPLPPRPPLPS